MISSQFSGVQPCPSGFCPASIEVEEVSRVYTDIADSSVTNYPRWFTAAAGATSVVNSIPEEHETGVVAGGRRRSRPFY